MKPWIHKDGTIVNIIVSMLEIGNPGKKFSLNSEILEKVNFVSKFYIKYNKFILSLINFVLFLQF